MNRRGLGAFKSAKKNTYKSWSQHDITMAIFKEIYKNLEICNATFIDRKNMSFGDFINKKTVTLQKVMKCTMYMLDTADRSAEKETLDAYDKIYSYIHHHAWKASTSLDHEHVKKALFMSKELINIWDQIPQNLR